MKPILTFCFLFLLSPHFSINAQSIIWQSGNKNAFIDEANEVIFDEKEVMLNTTTINCKKIIFKSTVEKITISGSVIISCNDVLLEKGKDNKPIEIKTKERKTGHFSLDFTGDYVDNDRKFKFKPGRKSKIKIG